MWLTPFGQVSLQAEPSGENISVSSDLQLDRPVTTAAPGRRLCAAPGC
jgi:hypothetical protein